MIGQMFFIQLDTSFLAAIRNQVSMKFSREAIRRFFNRRFKDKVRRSIVVMKTLNLTSLTLASMLLLSLSLQTHNYIVKAVVNHTVGAG